MMVCNTSRGRIAPSLSSYWCNHEYTDEDDGINTIGAAIMNPDPVSEILEFEFEPGDSVRPGTYILSRNRKFVYRR